MLTADKCNKVTYITMEISERMEHVESMKVHCTGSTHIVTADTTSWKKSTLALMHQK